MGHSSSPSSNPGLIRVLGPWVATAIVVGTVIGSGVFKKPSTIANEVPSFVFVALVWVLGGVLTILGALALAEVSVLFPRVGGNYVFLREGFGRPMGFLWGWVDFWMIRTGSIAALATVFVEALHDILCQAMERSAVLGYSDQRLITIGVIVILAGVNARGVRWGGGLQLVITLVKVGTLLAILILPFVLWREADPAFLQTPRPGAVFTWTGLGTAFLGVFWAYHGWMNIAPIAGEVKNPQRNLPLAFLVGTAIVMFLYVGANLAYHLVIPLQEIAELKDTPTVSAFFGKLFGSAGAMLASAALMISVFGALNGNLMVGPRLLYAMGEDRLAPRWLTAVHPRWHTPVRAIVVLAAWSSLLVLAAALLQGALGPPTADDLTPEGKDTLTAILRRTPLFDLLTDYAMFGAVIFETLAVTTIFVFRRTLAGADRPYRCWGYPAVPLLYLVLPAFIFVSMLFKQTAHAVAGLTFIGLGVVVYWLIFRGRAANPQR